MFILFAIVFLALAVTAECEKTIHKLHVNMRIKTEKTKGIKLFF
jgi:hypothetical protein